MNVSYLWCNLLSTNRRSRVPVRRQYFGPPLKLHGDAYGGGSEEIFRQGACEVGGAAVAQLLK